MNVGFREPLSVFRVDVDILSVFRANEISEHQLYTRMTLSIANIHASRVYELIKSIRC